MTVHPCASSVGAIPSYISAINPAPLPTTASGRLSLQKQDGQGRGAVNFQKYFPECLLSHLLNSGVAVFWRPNQHTNLAFFIRCISDNGIVPAILRRRSAWREF